MNEDRHEERKKKLTFYFQRQCDIANEEEYNGKIGSFVQEFSFGFYDGMVLYI